MLANAAMLVLGCGLLPFLRLARTRRELLTRAPLGYAVGVAATGIVAANLALAHVPVGRILLPVLAAVALLLGIRRVPRASEPWRRPRLGELPALAVLACTLVLAVPAARLFAVKPLFEFDGWAIWAARARASRSPASRRATRDRRKPERRSAGKAQPLCGPATRVGDYSSYRRDSSLAGSDKRQAQTLIKASVLL
jgi:predicted Kef-type K+ transport protein